jgi:hypothetical protein
VDLAARLCNLFAQIFRAIVKPSLMSQRQTPKKRNEKKKLSRAQRRKRLSATQPRTLKLTPGRISQSAPVATTHVRVSNRPQIETLRNGDSRIVHREYMFDVLAGTGTPSAYALYDVPLNPGQLTTFPWLSRLAVNYESYRFNKLRFCYETVAPSTLGGSLLLSVDYDALDPFPTSKVQAMASRSAVRSSPWADCTFTALPADLHKAKSNFIRSGAAAVGSDLRQYDIGKLFVISQGVGASGAALGELYVEYDVTLMTPVYEPNSVIALTAGGLASADGGAGISPTNPFGSDFPLYYNNYTGPALSTLSEFFPHAPGEYLVVLGSIGTGITGAAVTPYGSGALDTSLLDSIISSDAKHIITVWRLTVSNDLHPADHFYYEVVGTSVSSSQALFGMAPLQSLDPAIPLALKEFKRGSKPAVPVPKPAISVSAPSSSEQKTCIDGEGDVVMKPIVRRERRPTQLSHPAPVRRPIEPRAVS